MEDEVEEDDYAKVGGTHPSTRGIGRQRDDEEDGDDAELVARMREQYGSGKANTRIADRETEYQVQFIF